MNVSELKLAVEFQMVLNVPKYVMLSVLAIEWLLSIHTIESINYCLFDLPQPRASAGLPEVTHGWQLKVVLGWQLRFLDCITMTLRQEVVLDIQVPLARAQQLF